MSLATAWCCKLVLTVQITVWETPLNYRETLIPGQCQTTVLIVRTGATCGHAACGAAWTARKLSMYAQSFKTESIVLAGVISGRALCNTAWDAPPTRRPCQDYGAKMHHRSINLVKA